MNLNPVIRRRVALISSLSAALIATGYATAEHNRAAAEEREAREAQTVCQTEAATPAIAAISEETPLPKIRQAARDFILEKNPGAKIEGIFTILLGRDNSLAIAGADTTVDGQRRTIDLLVRLYTRKGGGTYWRAEGLGPERAAALMDKTSQTNAGDAMSGSDTLDCER